MAAINLRDRDGLHGRLFDVRCPVMWLHVSSLYLGIILLVLVTLQKTDLLEDLGVK